MICPPYLFFTPWFLANSLQLIFWLGGKFFKSFSTLSLSIVTFLIDDEWVRGFLGADGFSKIVFFGMFDNDSSSASVVSAAVSAICSFRGVARGGHRGHLPPLFSENLATAY